METPRNPEKPSLAPKDRAKLLAWLNSQRGRPQFRPAPRASNATSKVLRPLSKKFQNSQSAASLQPQWTRIVGEKWAKYSRPEKFTGGREGRTLVISAPGAAAAIIMASAGPIISRVNDFMGESGIVAIRVQQTRMTAPEPTKTDPSGPNPTPRGLSPREEDQLQSGLAHIPPSDLKSALEKLGRGIISRQTP